MSPWIAQRVILAYDTTISQGGTVLEATNAGRTKYAAFFINTRLYQKYRPDCDVILQTTGDAYVKCVVADGEEVEITEL